MSRPLYGSHAARYDELFADPVEPWVAAVCAASPPPGALLDAGCGTGRFSAGLAAAGYAVSLVDASPDLLALASARLPGAPAVVADLASLALSRRFDVIACRGVLNDIVDDDDRDAVLRGFAAHGDLVVADVRDRAKTRERYSAGHVTKRAGFEGRGRMDGSLVRVEERFDGGEAYEFVMRPWTPEEVRERFSRAGFDAIAIAESPGRPDRLLVTARARARSASPGGT